jgi:hypothetical protein
LGQSGWIAISAVLVSIASLLTAAYYRRSDIAREEAFRVRSRVWVILDREPGLRTVLALDDRDDKTAWRIKALQRTSRQLDVAGAPDLARLLDDVLSHRWGSQSTEDALLSRDEFIRAAQDRIRPV